MADSRAGLRVHLCRWLSYCFRCVLLAIDLASLAIVFVRWLLRTHCWLSPSDLGNETLKSSRGWNLGSLSWIPLLPISDRISPNPENWCSASLSVVKDLKHRLEKINAWFNNIVIHPLVATRRCSFSPRAQIASLNAYRVLMIPALINF